MANNRWTYQQTFNVSVNRKELHDIAQISDFNKKDYKVFLMLLTHLEGFNRSASNYAEHRNPLNVKDPRNFKAVDVKQMASEIEISKEDFKKSMNKMLKFRILQKGSNDQVKKGYRFTF